MISTAYCAHKYTHTHIIAFKSFHSLNVWDFSFATILNRILISSIIALARTHSPTVYSGHFSHFLFLFLHSQGELSSLGRFRTKKPSRQCRAPHNNKHTSYKWIPCIHPRAIPTVARSVWSQSYFHRTHLFVSFKTIHMNMHCMYAGQRVRGSGSERFRCFMSNEWTKWTNVIYFFTRPFIHPTLPFSLSLSLLSPSFLLWIEFGVLCQGWSSRTFSTTQKCFVSMWDACMHYTQKHTTHDEIRSLLGIVCVSVWVCASSARALNILLNYMRILKQTPFAIAL